MSAYKLSFVVPIYGVEQYIGKFAESVFNQTRSGVQYVFVNDGTRDASMEILERLIDEKYAHLRKDIVIVHQENQGLPIARKTGIVNASGEYILLIDSDDWIEPTTVEKLTDAMAQSDADMICFGFYKERRNRYTLKRNKMYKIEEKLTFIADLYNYRAFGYTWNKCFRRSLYVDYEMHTPPHGMHEDIYLMSQIIYHARSFYHIKDYLYHYRTFNLSSISSQSRRNREVTSVYNQLDLYDKFRSDIDHSPLKEAAGGIVLRAVWNGLKFKEDFYATYPWLEEEVRKARVGGDYLLPLYKQLYVKLYNHRRMNKKQ